MSVLEIEMFGLATVIMLAVVANTCLLVHTIGRVKEVHQRLDEVLAWVRPAAKEAA